MSKPDMIFKEIEEGPSSEQMAVIQEQLAAECEIDGLDDTADWHTTTAHHLRLFGKLLAECKLMKAALEFYADPKTYDPEPIEQARARTGGDPTTGVQWGTLRYQAGPGFAIPPIVADQNGNRARAALNAAGKDT